MNALLQIHILALKDFRKKPSSFSLQRIRLKLYSFGHYLFIPSIDNSGNRILVGDKLLFTRFIDRGTALMDYLVEMLVISFVN